MGQVTDKGINYAIKVILYNNVAIGSKLAFNHDRKRFSKICFLKIGSSRF